MSDHPRVAIIGCGAITERFYLPGAGRIGGILQNLILVDQDLERARQLATEFGCSDTAQDYSTVKADGVIVAAPTHLHFEIASHFLEGGIPTLVEKPLAQTFEEASHLVTESDCQGVPLLVNQTRRFYPVARYIQESLCELGPLRDIRFEDGGLFEWPTRSGFYFHGFGAPRGVLLDRGAHVIDLLCWWMGEKPSVVSCQHDSFGGPEGVAEVLLRAGSCNIAVFLTWLGRPSNRFELHSENASLVGRSFDFNCVQRTYRGDTLEVKLGSMRSMIDVATSVLRNFIGVIRGDCAPVASAKSVLSSLAVIDECYRTASQYTLPWYQRWKTVEL